MLVDKKYNMFDIVKLFISDMNYNNKQNKKHQ